MSHWRINSRGRILFFWMAILAFVSILFNPRTIAFIEGKAEWKKVKTRLQERYPRLKRIAPAELAAWLEDDAQPAPLLVDVRDRTEYEVSHLFGAVLMEPGSPVSRSFSEVAKDHPIVTYCSVGYRSSYLARKLMRKGFTRVYELEGSIFEWANEGFPVYSGTEATRLVHPYNRKWGRLLDTRYHPPSA